MKKAINRVLSLAIAIVALFVIFLSLSPFLPRSGSVWNAEIQRHGWKVLYSKTAGNRFVAVCNAGPNQLAIIDSETTSQPSTVLTIMNSSGNEIQSKGKITPITCMRWLIYKDVGGFIYPIEVPPDKQIRIVEKANREINGDFYVGRGPVLIDVEVSWSD
jgi:hypothetical protein